MDVLIIEGNRSVARLFGNVLSAQGWAVDIVHDGSEARERIEGDRPYNVVLMSYVVPGSGGAELVRLARGLNHRADLPILIVSGTSGIEGEVLDAGANEVIKKPVEIGTLLSAISRLTSSS